MTTTYDTVPARSLDHHDPAADALQQLVSQTSAAVAADPALAVITPAASSGLARGTTTEVRVSAGRHSFTIDEPPTLGGTDLGANPVEHLLAALGACQVITYRVWAAKLGIALDSVDVDVTGRLDVRGFFGVDPSVRPGFESLEVSAVVSGPEDPERYRELTRVVEEHCPVLDVLLNGVPVASTVTYTD